VMLLELRSLKAFDKWDFPFGAELRSFSALNTKRRVNWLHDCCQGNEIRGFPRRLFVNAFH